MTHTQLPSRFAVRLISASLLMAFAGGALARAPQQPAPPAAPVSGETAPAAPVAVAEKPDPTAPKPFKEVIRGAHEKAGYFTLYQKDDKVWIEIRPEQLGKPFFFSANISNGVGERGLYASQMGQSHMVVFKKIGNLVQLIAKNTAYTAQAGTPQARAVSQGFSDSLIASAPVASGPNATTKGFLVDVSSLLFSDIPGYATNLETAFRMPFALDARNTSISSARTDADMTGFAVSAHYAVPKIAAQPLVPVPGPHVAPPQVTPDPRSLFVGFYYSFAPLPAEPMHARPADDRIGHFVTRLTDFTDDFKPKPSTHVVNRWRLEKKDPAAALSEPMTPIV